LTLFRVVAIPVIVVLLFYTGRLATFLAAVLFSAAAITDYLDGFYARRTGMVSNIGKVMDPVADKLLVSSAFIMLTSHGWVPAWAICIIIGRELSVTGLRNIIAERGGDVSATILGKYKTGFQIACLIPLLLHYPYFGINFHGIGIFFLWGALIFTVWSGVDYFIRFRKLLKE
jgi:CDP-diacylglycerol--glycerol-3-phosphate 3-phosphatidyltransferase